jgi:hypothetical protein
MRFRPAMTIILLSTSLAGCTEGTPNTLRSASGTDVPAEVNALPTACDVVPDDLRRRLVGTDPVVEPTSQDLPENSVRGCIWSWSSAAPATGRPGPATRNLAVDLTLHRSRETLGNGAQRAHERVSRHVAQEQSSGPRPISDVGDEAYMWPVRQEHRMLLVFRRGNVVGEVEYTGTDWQDDHNTPMSGTEVSEAATEVARAAAAGL